MQQKSAMKSEQCEFVTGITKLKIVGTIQGIEEWNLQEYNRGLRSLALYFRIGKTSQDLQIIPDGTDHNQIGDHHLHKGDSPIKD